MYTLAHLSDPHVGPLPRPRWHELMNKRFLGYLSWRGRRHRLHRPEVLDALVNDLKQTAPDHVAVTGDLVNISLPDEFPQAASWLARLGPAERVSVVPGNHDAYVQLPWEDSLEHWAANMSSDPRHEAEYGSQEGRFPYLRLRGPLAVIGLSTAVPTPPLFASGRLGGAQLAALDGMLPQLAAEGRFRVVLLHHPPLSPPSQRRKWLTDAHALRQIIAKHGAELLLHGHNHLCEEARLDSRAGEVPVLGIASASAALSGHRPESHYRLCRIAAVPSGWHIDADLRRYDAATGRFTAGQGQRIELVRKSVNRPDT